MPDDLQEIQLTRTATLRQRRAGHRTATDDVLCAWAAVQAMPAGPTAPTAVSYLDLGAGHGSVTLMVSLTLPTLTGAAIEVQKVSWELLVDNLATNGVADRIEAVHADLRSVDALPRGRRFDLISGSPPFMPLGTGPLPVDPQRAGGRFELRGGIEAYAEATARWLAPQGRAVLLMDGASEARCRAAFINHGLAVERTIVVLPRNGARCRYRIYILRRLEAAAPGETSVTLTIRDADGAWTDAFSEVRRALDLPARRRSGHPRR